MEETSSKTLQCVVVTPERAVLDETVSFVAVPMYDGELGVLPGRAPLIGRLGAGELRIIRNHNTERFFVDGGFVQVADNVVAVLTNRAVPTHSLDPAAAETQLAAALQKPANTPELREIRERAVAQARAQLRAARHARV